MEATTIAVDEALWRFVSHDELRRESMRRPCLKGDVVQATNGNVGIEIPSRLLNREYEADANFPNLSAILETSFAGDYAEDLPVHPIREAINSIPESALQQDCDKCHGRGWINCWCCGYDGECSTCEGHGYLEVLASVRVSATTAFLAVNLEPVIAVADAIGVDQIRLVKPLNSHTSSLAAHVGEARIVVMPFVLDPDAEATVTAVAPTSS